MDLSHTQIALRPRRTWEATDLGFIMLRAWWKSIYAITGLTVMASMGLIYAGAEVAGVTDEHLAYVMLAGVWWLKPAYDRFVLAVLSSAVFGTVPTVISLLRGAPRLLGSGLLAQLTSSRIDFARSFRLPVWQLERLPRSARRARFRVLEGRTRGHASGITFVFLHIEAVLYVGIFGLIYLLVPAASLDVGIEPAGNGSWFRLLPEGVVAVIVYAGVVTFVEPIYVACGFGLYLNRRTLLEAWDIEIDFRRIAKRLSESGRNASAPRGLSGFVLSAALLMTGVPVDGHAALEPVAASPVLYGVQETAAKVLSEPPFLVRVPETGWSLRTDWDWPAWLEWPEWLDLEWEVGVDGNVSTDAWQQFILWLAQGLEALLWTMLVAVVVWLAIRGARWSREQRSFSRSMQSPGQISVEITPGSLPHDLSDDPAGRAETLAAAEDYRAALALLYQASLWRLEGRGVRLAHGATEGDLLRAMRSIGGSVGGDVADYMGRLVPVWLETAYADRQPSASSVAVLCRDWRQLFGSPSNEVSGQTFGDPLGATRGK